MDRLSFGTRHFLDEKSDHTKSIISVLQRVFVTIKWPEDLFTMDDHESPFMDEQVQEVVSVRF